MSEVTSIVEKNEKNSFAVGQAIDEAIVKEIETPSVDENRKVDLDKTNTINEETEKTSSEKPSPQDHLHSLCADMFNKLSQYMNSEVATTLEDYKLLEKMNMVTMDKYDSMLEMAKSTGNNLHSLNQKLADLQPYLDMIEAIETKVIALEQAAYKLDAYSKHLEERFKRIERH